MRLQLFLHTCAGDSAVVGSEETDVSMPAAADLHIPAVLCLEAVNR